ncbi:MAG TPA: DUF2520 domain-containing protein [Myxococcota bacterium]|nr:DUF2520 domain-containing protein [Myxococcota bacterium]HOH77565.1 DUF2520 domain-containing protein [Myxococcota bacterium]
MTREDEIAGYRPTVEVRVVVCGHGRVGGSFARSCVLAAIPTWVIDVQSVVYQMPTILPIGMNAAMSVKFVPPVSLPTLWYLCTPEHVNDDLVRQICESPGFNRATDCIAVASATWDTSRVPEDLGASVGRAHPLHPFPPAATLMPVPCGTPFGTSGLPEFAIHLLESMGFVPFALDDQDRYLYHAAAVLVSNLPAALVQQAAGIFMRCGVPDGHVVAAGMLCALAEVISTSGPASVPGPAARGDHLTVKADQDAIDRHDPDTGHVHRILSEVIVKMTSGSDNSR